MFDLLSVRVYTRKMSDEIPSDWLHKVNLDDLYRECLNKVDEATIKAIKDDDAAKLADLLFDYQRLRINRDFDDVETGGTTIVHLCAMYNAPDCLEYLISQYSNDVLPILNAENNRSITPLFMVVQKFNIKDCSRIVDIFTSNGVDMKEKVGRWKWKSPWEISVEKSEKDQKEEEERYARQREKMQSLASRKKENCLLSNDQSESS